MSFSPPQLVGATFAGRYRVERLLGEGGMGAVYLARTLDGRPVALKVTKTDGPDARFEREARLAAGLHHPNIVDVFDFGHDPAHGLAYLVMEYIDGESFFDALSRAPLPWKTCLYVIERIADALDAAHIAGITHRDVKPDNIVLVGAAGDLRPVLIDFGIARSSEAEYHTLTAEGAILGTPYYMAPEQAKRARVGPPADVWALGATLYEALCGEPPFASSGSAMQVMLAKQHERPPRVSEVRGLAETDFPPALDELVAAMLAVDPSARPTAAEISRRAGALVANPNPTLTLGADRLLTLREGTAQPRERNPRVKPAAAGPSRAANSLLLLPVIIVLAGMFLVGVWVLWPDGDSAAPPETVPREHPPSTPSIPPPPDPELHGTSDAAVLDRDVDAGEDASAPPAYVPRPSDGCGFAADPDHPLRTRHDDPSAFGLYVPRNYDPAVPLPITFVVARRGATPAYMLKDVGFAEFADTHRTLVLITQSYGDVSYPPLRDTAIASLEHVAQNYCVDLGRRWGIGVGRGTHGIMKLARDIEFSGIATINNSRNQRDDHIVPPTAIPHIHLYGFRNTRALEAGGFMPGCSRPEPPLHGRQVVPAADERDEWIRGHRCRSPERIFFDHEEGRCVTWDCDVSPFVWCRVDADRRLPGEHRVPYFPQCYNDPVTKFPYLDTVWSFFQASGRPL